MATTAAANTRSYAFDERIIRWYKLGDFEYFVFAMLDGDAPQKIVDFIAKFEPTTRFSRIGTWR